MADRCWFGTDGIRGHVGSVPMTPDWIVRLGWAAGRVLVQGGERRVLIAKDTRISGYMFESALEAGFSAAGADVLLTGPLPTPAVAYLTQTFRCGAGVVVSASHNPCSDNGVKFFSRSGGKLDESVEEAIEAQLEQPLEVVAASQIGKAQRIKDARGRYIEFCKGVVRPNLRFEKLRLVIDCAHGATYQVAPAVFRELGATVLEEGVAPDGLNINEGVGAMSPEKLVKRVLAEQANLGIAFDGDGDRVIMVDEHGSVVTGDGLLYVLARHYQRSGKLDGGVVGTVLSGRGLEVALRKLGVPFERAGVGDRNVMAECRRQGWYLGGEASGHILCLKEHCTGDGIVAALKVLEALDDRGETLAQACAEFEQFPQRQVDVPTAQPAYCCDTPQLLAAATHARQELGEDGNVIIRPSGTEPLVRIMVEGRDVKLVDRHIQDLRNLVLSIANPPADSRSA